MVDDLLCGLTKAGYTTVGYADDIVTLIRGKFWGTVSEMMQGALKFVEKWCAKHGLSVNPAKTHLVPFTKKTGNKGIKEIVFYETILQTVGEVKYLGVTLDSKLTFKPHLERITTKATRTLWTCR